MAEYDNTDKGAAFKPFDTQKLILQGKINDEGTERKIVLIKDTTKSGKQIIEIFEKAGTLFVNEKKESENAPDYTGPIKSFVSDRRMAAWKRLKDGNPYMTLAISDARAKEEITPESKSSIEEDEVPW
jgi:uncharacterized protein (DUF736 family)